MCIDSSADKKKTHTVTREIIIHILVIRTGIPVPHENVHELLNNSRHIHQICKYTHITIQCMFVYTHIDY